MSGSQVWNRSARNSFLGSGWLWPIDVDATGAMALVCGTQELEQAMYLVLLTEPGERPMRPQFGCRLRQFVFAPADATTAALVAAEVRQALTRWEPRVTVDDVEITVDGENTSALWVDVHYTVRSTNDRRNLVVPFYLIPGDEDGAVVSAPPEVA